MTEPTQPLGVRIKQMINRPEAMWIVLMNAIPIAGVLFLGWPALSLLLFYWFENVVIGVFNAFKIAISGFTKSRETVGITAFLVPFFCFHYGLFCYVHGEFLITIFQMAGAIHGLGGVPADSFELVPVLSQQLATNDDLRLGVYGLIGVQALWFAVLWLGRGAWRTANPAIQMIEPYGRVVVMHLTILVAAIPVLLLGQPVIAVLALAVLKCCLELGLPLIAIDLSKTKDPSIDKYSR